MADLPSVVFISCSDVDPDDIISLVINKPENLEKKQIYENIYSFPWSIDSKYYTAEIRLCSLKKKSLCDKEFSDSVQGVVVYFDSAKEHALEDVESWLPFINVFAPEIKILVCNNIKCEKETSTGTCKLTALEWCISRGFELVELEPKIDNVNDEAEDDFLETTGVHRIVQALYAHVWPNLVMKSAGEKVSCLKRSVDQGSTELSQLREQLCLEKSLEELLETDDDFSKMFSQLSEMKERVSSLSGSEKKAAAEQVVKAFWKCLNEGSEEEFSDL